MKRYSSRFLSLYALAGRHKIGTLANQTVNELGATSWLAPSGRLTFRLLQYFFETYSQFVLADECYKYVNSVYLAMKPNKAISSSINLA